MRSPIEVFSNWVDTGKDEGMEKNHFKPVIKMIDLFDTNEVFEANSDGNSVTVKAKDSNDKIIEFNCDYLLFLLGIYQIRDQQL